jgi:hypothetical protein
MIHALKILRMIADVSKFTNQFAVVMARPTAMNVMPLAQELQITQPELVNKKMS